MPDLFYKHSACTYAVSRWHLGCGQLLNLSKTETIINCELQLVKFDKNGDIEVVRVTVPFSDTLLVLGITIDKHLTFDAHVGNILRASNYHVRAL